jgi:ABC-type uncharacterized transport system involved in gliding motility auxiliary subunit
MTGRFSNIQRSLFSVGGVLIVLLIVILVNVIFSVVSLRWDATENNLYSLSKGTEKILSNLSQPVTIKVFYSKSVVNMPTHIKNFARRVLDFLNEYRLNSHGKVTIEIYDPKVDSEEEEWAQNYGINAMRLSTGETVYFGLVALAMDQEETIPFIDPTREPHLEYDITRIISRVQAPKNKTISIISSLPIFGGPPMGFGQPEGMPEWLFVTELKKSYTVKQVAPNDEKIDEDTDLLILYHPKNLSDTLQFAIDQYLLKGGNIIVYADPFCILDNPQGGGRSSNPKRLFKSWGISMDSSKVVMDMQYATRVRGPDNQPENNPLWLSSRPAGFNKDDIITANLESTLMPLAGALVKASDSPYDFEALLQSSTDSALVEASKQNFGVEALRRDFKPSGERYTLAAKISGKFKSAFPEGAPPKSDSAGEASSETKANANAAGVLKEAVETATIVVVTDADMLYDGYYVSKQNFLGFDISNVFNDNLNFLLNASEMLTGDNALIAIRSRGTFDRPFTRVQALEAKAQHRWLAREQELEQQAQHTNEKLRQLEQQKDAAQKTILSPEQEAEIAKFQDEKHRINQELKIVRRNLRAEIESLGSMLKLINIFLMPLLVSIAGIVYALVRRRRMASRVVH